MSVMALRPAVPMRVAAPVAAVAWLAAWLVNAPLADWIAFGALRLERGSQLGEAVAFLLYDIPKVLLLLLGVVTVVTFVRSYFPPERMRSALAGRGTVPATAAAAGFGVVTPFCHVRLCLVTRFVDAGSPGRTSRSIRAPVTSRTSAVGLRRLVW